MDRIEHVKNDIRFCLNQLDYLSSDDIMSQFKDYFQMALETIDENNIDEIEPDIVNKESLFLLLCIIRATRSLIFK